MNEFIIAWSASKIYSAEKMQRVWWFYYVGMGPRTNIFILLPGHILYRKPWGHKIVCTGDKFKSCVNVVKNHTDSFLLLKRFRKSIVWPIFGVLFQSIGEKVKGQVFGSTGVKQVEMLKFCWQWSQNVHQVNTIKNQNSLSYVRCFVTMVMPWVTLQRRSANGH